MSLLPDYSDSGWSKRTGVGVEVVLEMTSWCGFALITEKGDIMGS